MMKKTGFTLAEVLITLAIIGVVATLTLPALMTNTGEQQYKTAFKKGINTLTEAGQMGSAVDGLDYSSITVRSAEADTETTQSLLALLRRRTNVNYGQSGLGRFTEGASAAANYAVFLRDGAVISFNPTNSTSNGTTGRLAANTVMNDNLHYGIAVLYDVNGNKGPNLVTNCNGVLSGSLATIGNDNAQDPRAQAACGNKTRRIIKDQFPIRLRDTYAVPNSAGARFVFQD